MRITQANQSFRHLSGISAIVFLAIAANAQTNGASPELIEELKKLPVEELIRAPVTSVERRSSTIAESPAAIAVITQEDIRRSGATTIPELLRRVPGMDVARITGNIWAVSARGFNDRFADKVLVQIDGRSLYNPLIAGTYWLDYPLDDIERIEVIRGPAASVWGANACNGVVNIITKSSKDTEGGLLTAGGGNQELGFGSVRYGGKPTPDLTYRVYAKGFDRDSNFSLEGNPNDQWWGASTGMRLDWTPNRLNSVQFESGYAESTSGQSTLRPIPTAPFRTINLGDQIDYNAFALSRWVHRQNDESIWTVQLYWDRIHSDSNFRLFRWDTFDVDAQHEISIWDRNKIVYGVGYRFIDIFGSQGFSVSLIPPTRQLNLPNAFAQDEFTIIPDRFYLIAGSKFEHNDYTGFEIQPTGRLLWTPTTNQSAWAAVSRAVRTPSPAQRDLRITGLPVAPGVFPQIEPNPNFGSENLLAFELGYRVQATRALNFDLALYHNIYDNLSVAIPGPPTAPPISFVPLTFVNGASGETDGAELAATWQALRAWRLYGTYTLFQEHIHGNIPGSLTPQLTRQSPQQQVYLQSSFDLPHNVDLDLIGRWVDELPGFTPATPAYFALDVRLAWRQNKNLEWAIVGQNLTDDHHPEFGTNPFIRTTVVEIERSIYAKVTWRF